MRTSKPISTISYNSATFLYGRLEELVKSKRIVFWCVVYHKAEKDEAKDHFHVYIVPNGLLDTMDLQDFFIEPVLNEKPYKCLPFDRSNADDWILYGLHDEVYLLSKMETREFHYEVDDLCASDEDYLAILVKHAYEESKFAIERKKLNMLRNAENPASLVFSGLYSVRDACGILALNRLNRGGRKNHEVEEND